MSSSNDLPLEKRRKLDLSQKITVVAGKSEKRFTVPKCFLTRTSDFFEACFKGEWEEARNREVRVPINPEVLSTYLQWLYTGELVTGYEIDKAPDVYQSLDQKAQRRYYFHELARLAIAASFFQDKALENVIIDAVTVSSSESVPLNCVSTLRSIDEEIPKSSGFYKVIIDILVSKGNAEIFTIHKDHHPRDLIFDVATAFMKSRGGNHGNIEPSLANSCVRYHHHDDRTPRCTHD